MSNTVTGIGRPRVTQVTGKLTSTYICLGIHEMEEPQAQWATSVPYIELRLAHANVMGTLSTAAGSPSAHARQMSVKYQDHLLETVLTTLSLSTHIQHCANSFA